MDRTQKEQVVSDLRGIFDSTTSVVIAHNTGLTVAEMTDLRNRAREAGASFKVTKNRLTRLALDGTKCNPLTDMFTGPTAIAYSDDPVAAAKVTADFAKENDKLVLLGGMMDETVLDVAGVKALAAMPSMDELRAKILGVINTPATRIAGVTKAPAGQLARVFAAYGSSGEAA